MINSDSVGDPSTFQRLDVLETNLPALNTPRDQGRVVLIVSRGQDGRRQEIERTTLTPESGVPGDAWGRRRGSANSQLAVIQSDVATMIANGQPLSLFGDNLYLHLDLSNDNLPAGSRLRAGSVTLEVTPTPHDGCQKFNARFGNGALKFVSKKPLRHRNLRGVYMKVIEAGDIAVGDVIDVVSRGAAI